MVVDCDRESEVLDAIARGTAGRAGDIRDHLASCASCAEAAAIAAALRADDRARLRDAHLPAAGTLWWRATIRARAEAARTVSQPITLAQGIAAACAIGLACGLAGMAWQWLPMASMTDMVGALERRDELAAAFALVLQHALPLALGLAACLLIAPLALYFALADD